MKHVKRVLALLLVLCCSAGMIAPAFATEIVPFSLATNNARAYLSIGSNGIASCNIFVKAKDIEQYVEVTTTLYRMQGNTSSPEVSIASWSAKERYSVSDTRTYQVIKGYKYQLWSNVVVRDSSNNLIESFWIYSNIC